MGLIIKLTLLALLYCQVIGIGIFGGISLAFYFMAWEWQDLDMLYAFIRIGIVAGTFLFISFMLSEKGFKKALEQELAEKEKV